MNEAAFALQQPLAALAAAARVSPAFVAIALRAPTATAAPPPS